MQCSGLMIDTLIVQVTCKGLRCVERNSIFVYAFLCFGCVKISLCNVVLPLKAGAHNLAGPITHRKCCQCITDWMSPGTTLPCSYQPSGMLVLFSTYMQRRNISCLYTPVHRASYCLDGSSLGQLVGLLVYLFSLFCLLPHPHNHAGFGQAGSALLPFMTGALANKFGINSLQPL